jgi:hypothetical protein
MSVQVIPAKKRHKYDCGDLVCEFYQPDSGRYLEDNPCRDGQIIPLGVFYPNPWDSLKVLEIDVTLIKIEYVCPYTDFHCFSIVPTALIRTNLEEKWGELVQKKWGNSGYVLDHEWHKSAWGDVCGLSDIARLLLGSGYTEGTHIHDGSRERKETTVRLSNGDAIWVHFWEWYNK